MTKLTTEDNPKLVESSSNKKQEITDEKGIPKTIWNQEQLTELLGYSQQEKTQNLDGIHSQSETNTQSEKQNIIAQSELFDDDPRKQKTKHRFSNNPFSKVSTVALAMFVLCAFIGILMNTMTSGGPSRAPSIHTKTTPPPKAEISDTTTPEKLENGKLKASLALNDQVRAVKAVEDSKKNQVKIKFNNKRPSQPHTQKVAKISQTTRKPSSKIVYRSPRRIPPPPKQIPQNNIVRQIDPIAQLQAINRLGSYGSEAIPQTSEKQLNNQNFNTIPQVNQLTLQNPQILEINKPSQQVDSSLQQTQFLPEEEKIINGNNNHNNIRVGSIIPGKLVSPLVWVENNAKQNNSELQKVVLATTEPIIKNDRIILPENTEIIATIANVQSGFVQLQATQLVVNDQEYSLPSGAITINGHKGNPLIASKWNNKHRQTARDAEIFLLGSLAQVGNVLNQPRSQQFSTNSGFGGNTTFSSTQRGRSNMLGAVLSGGFSPLTQQILQRNQKSLQQKINSESKVWFLKADTEIEIFVNQSFSLD